jgi:hypothetical protein
MVIHIKSELKTLKIKTNSNIEIKPVCWMLLMDIKIQIRPSHKIISHGWYDTRQKMEMYIQPANFTLLPMRFGTA